MGNCVYCNKPAGFFRKKHSECKKKYLEGKKIIIDTILEVVHGSSIGDIDKVIDDTCRDCFIEASEKKSLIIDSWEKAVEEAFADSLLTEDEESKLLLLKERFGLTREELDVNGSYTEVGQGVILRNVMEGVLPEPIIPNIRLPFNFQKSEQLIWFRDGVDYSETKAKTKYVGGSQGISIRIAKGVYYRTSSFKGKKVVTDEVNYVDTGAIAITNKHIYFGGSNKIFRIRLNKIVSFIPYSDGFGLVKDTAKAKPQIFLTGNGWFVYNLVLNIGNLV